MNSKYSQFHKFIYFKFVRIDLGGIGNFLNTITSVETGAKFMQNIFTIIANFSICCDPNADCSCGTTSGHYACICKPGFYGNGLVGQCECENFLLLNILYYLFLYTNYNMYWGTCFTGETRFLPRNVI